MTHPDRQLTRTFAGVALFLLAAKFVGAAKEILLAQAYGVGPLMDAYQFVLQLANWPASIFFAVASAILIPIYAGLRREGAPQLIRFRRQVHGATLLLTGLMTLGWLWLCVASPLLPAWSGLTVAVGAQAVRLALPMTILVLCSLYTALLSVECISEQRAQGSTLIEAIPPCVLGATLLFIARPDTDTLVLGTVGGALAHIGVLALYARRFELPRPTFHFDSARWRPLLMALGTLLAAQTLQATTTVIDQLWAARAAEGSLSVIGYANRVLLLAIALGTTAIARTVLPLLADLTLSQIDYARQLAWRWAGRLLLISSLSVLLLWPLSPWGVALLFERGAFGPEETDRVATFLQFSWLQLPPACAGLVLIQQVLAERRYRFLLLTAGVNLLVKLAGNALLVPWLGIEGLALASAGMHFTTLAMLLLWWRLRRHD